MRTLSKTLLAVAGMAAVLGAASTASAHDGWRHHHRHHRVEASHRLEHRDHRDGGERR